MAPNKGHLHTYVHACGCTHKHNMNRTHNNKQIREWMNRSVWTKLDCKVEFLSLVPYYQTPWLTPQKRVMVSLSLVAGLRGILMFSSVQWRSWETYKKQAGSGPLDLCLLLTLGRSHHLHHQKRLKWENGLGCSGLALTAGAKSGSSVLLNLYRFLESLHGTARKAIS